MRPQPKAAASRLDGFWIPAFAEDDGKLVIPAQAGIQGAHGSRPDPGRVDGRHLPSPALGCDLAAGGHRQPAGDPLFSSVPHLPPGKHLS